MIKMYKIMIMILYECIKDIKLTFFAKLLLLLIFSNK